MVRLAFVPLGAPPPPQLENAEVQFTYNLSRELLRFDIRQFSWPRVSVDGSPLIESIATNCGFWTPTWLTVSTGPHVVRAEVFAWLRNGQRLLLYSGSRSYYARPWKRSYECEPGVPENGNYWYYLFDRWRLDVRSGPVPMPIG